MSLSGDRAGSDVGFSVSTGDFDPHQVVALLFLVHELVHKQVDLYLLLLLARELPVLYQFDGIYAGLNGL